MALIIETHHFGDMGQCHALAQQGQGALDMQVDLVGMRRQAELGGKCLQKMEPAQPGNCGNLVQRHGMGEVASCWTSNNRC